MVKSSARPAGNGRWGYVALGFLINLCLGAVYSWSIFKKPVEQLYNKGATASGLPYMFSLAAFALLMPLAGRLLDRYGPRIITAAGGALVGLGWVLAGFSSNLTMLTVCYALCAGGGVGLAYGGPLLVATRWFPDKKGLALGLTLAGFGLSALLTAPVAEKLIGQWGVGHTFKFFGLVFAVLVVAAALFFKLPPSGWKPKEFIETASVSSTNELGPGRMLASPAFWGLWFTYTIGTLTGLMAIGISKPVGQEVSLLSPATAAVAVSVFALFNGAGRPAFGWLTGKISPRFAAIASFTILFFASVGMLALSRGNPVVYLVSFSAFWLCLGGWLAIAPTATAVFFGTKHYSTNYGIMFTAYGAGAILGSLIAGRLRDVLGSYIYAFYPTAALAIVGVLLAVFLLKPPPKP